MTTTWCDEIACDQCGTVGTYLWAEGGYQDRDEWDVEIWASLLLSPVRPIPDFMAGSNALPFGVLGVAGLTGN
jgi:hypothetical protein